VPTHHQVNAELTEDLAKYRGTSKPHFLVLKDGEFLHGLIDVQKEWKPDQKTPEPHVLP
jgi:hypothetical protein